MRNYLHWRQNRATKGKAKEKLTIKGKQANKKPTSKPVLQVSKWTIIARKKLGKLAAFSYQRTFPKQSHAQCAHI